MDYSKWQNIEVSDDEDDTHPNIHTPYLFRLRHESRLKKMKEIQATLAFKLNFNNSKKMV